MLKCFETKVIWRCQRVVERIEVMYFVPVFWGVLICRCWGDDLLDRGRFVWNQDVVEMFHVDLLPRLQSVFVFSCYFPCGFLLCCRNRFGGFVGCNVKRWHWGGGHVEVLACVHTFLILCFFQSRLCNTFCNHGKGLCISIHSGLLIWFLVGASVWWCSTFLLWCWKYETFVASNWWSLCS